MRNGFKNFIALLKNEAYHTKEEEIQLYQEIIDGVINAKSGTDLKILLIQVQNFDWYEKMRYTFLMGLLQGALMQFKKDVSIDELERIFKHF